MSNLNKFEIRELKADDFNNGYIDLLGQYFSIDSSKMTQEFFNKQYEFLKKKTNYYIRVIIEPDTNRIIATGSLFIEFKFVYNLAKVAYIDDIIIDNGYRNIGLGKKLLNHLKVLSNANGCIQINVISPNNASGFFEKNGFSDDNKHLSIKLRK